MFQIRVGLTRMSGINPKLSILLDFHIKTTMKMLTAFGSLKLLQIPRSNYIL